MKKTLAALVVCALAGCATTSGMAPTETKSGFSGGRVVTISGHGNACSSFFCTGLGAQWDSSTPDRAILQVHIFNDWKGITGAALSIDGRIVELQKLPGLSQFSKPGEAVKQTTQSFGVPLSLVREVVAAKKVWIRVHTTAGYMEDAVIDGEKDSKAYHALVRFLAQVDGTDTKN